MKSYSPNLDGHYLVNGTPDYLTTTDVVYMSTAEYTRLSSNFTETDDWKTIVTTNVPTGGGNIVATKTLSGLTTEEILTVNMAITTGDMDAGTTLVALVKNAAGDTLETINYTFGAISAAANADFIFKPGSLVVGTSVLFTFTLIDSTATFDADIVITPSDISESEEAAIITVGTAVTTAAAQVDIVLVDADGVAITDQSVVDVFMTDTDFAPKAITTLAVATNGASLGDITVKQALVALSKADGTLRVNVTYTTGTTYINVRLKNGKIFRAPVIHTAT